MCNIRLSDVFRVVECFKCGVQGERLYRSDDIDELFCKQCAEKELEEYKSMMFEDECDARAIERQRA